MSLGLGPGVSVFIPDVLMGSPGKPPSHGILTAVWNMGVICLPAFPTPFSVRLPCTHFCPPSTIWSCWRLCINVLQNLGQVGHTYLAILLAGITLCGLVPISLPEAGTSWRTS